MINHHKKYTLNEYLIVFFSLLDFFRFYSLTEYRIFYNVTRSNIFYIIALAIV